jgi:GNAT superfamily N-acetyltransferase
MHDIQPAPALRIHEARHEGFLLSTDPSRLDIAVIHSFLTEDSYWAKGIDRALLCKAISGSIPIGVYDSSGAQVGFARVITDRALFAYLRDVFVVSTARGRGLGTFIAREAVAHPDLADVRRWMLATQDAHGLYEKVGFKPVEDPNWYMALNRGVNRAERPLERNQTAGSAGG